MFNLTFNYFFLRIFKLRFLELDIKTRNSLKKINSLLGNFVLPFAISLILGCLGEKPEIVESVKINSVNPDYFILDNLTEKVQQKTVKLSGIETLCYVVKSNSQASEHQMGPWCPRQLEDPKEKGGIWFKGGEVYPVDGEFIHNLAVLYKDEYWLMYDDDDGHCLLYTSDAADE